MANNDPCSRSERAGKKKYFRTSFLFSFFTFPFSLLPTPYSLLLLFIFLAHSLFSLSFHDDVPPEELAAAIEEAMTDEQALAQVFMLGWTGGEPSPLIMEWIRVRNIGSVKVFGWNTTDTQRLSITIGEMQKASLEGAFNVPLLVATDQEGGWVRHVKGNTSETPGNMALGASGYPQDAFLSGYYIGKELALLGINFNFAPMVDLFTNRNSDLIRSRAFGKDPVQTGILGAAFMKGQLAAGVIPTAKHFPGHGDTALDSHGVLPRINISMETLYDRELIPFRMLVAEGIPAIMSGHLSFPLTDGGSAPASLSPFFLRSLLRGNMGFNGIIITDDLMMNGALSYMGGSVARTAKQALIAGNDIIMFSTTPRLLDPVWTSLADSMKNEEEFRLTVRKSARRIIEFKLRYLRMENAVPYIPNPASAVTDLPLAEGKPFFLNLAARSVTIVLPKDDTDSVFPVTANNAGRVLLAGKYRDFFNYGRIAFPNASVYRYFEEWNSADFVSRARNADTIIFCLSDASDLRLLRSIERLNKNIIVFSILNPVFIESVPWVNGAIAVYNYAPESFAAGFSVITGKIKAHGILPYEFE